MLICVLTKVERHVSVGVSIPEQVSPDQQVLEYLWSHFVSEIDPEFFILH